MPGWKTCDGNDDRFVNPTVHSYLEADTEQPVRHELGWGECIVYTHRAPDKDAINDDAAIVLDIDQQQGILAVADGVGGERAASTASYIMLETLADTMSDLGSEHLREVILSSADEANRKILDLGVGAATTLAAVEISEGTIRPYHVGDSPILLVGQRGKVKFQAIAHSPVGYALESGLLDEDEAVSHEDRHFVSNVVGSNEMRIDIGPILDMAKHDTLLLASDGLSDNLLTEDITDIIRSGPLEKAAKLLLQTCQHNMREGTADHPGKPDDLSFILYRRN